MSPDLGVLIDVERMLCVSLAAGFTEQASRAVTVCTASDVPPDLIETYGLPLVTVQATNGLSLGSWQQRLGFTWEIAWTVVAAGRDIAFEVADETYQLLHALPMRQVDGFPGGGVFGGPIEDLQLPSRTAQVVLAAQEIVQFDGAVRLTVTPHQ